MRRITKKSIESILKIVNDCVKDHTKEKLITLSGRYDYTVLEYVDSQGLPVGFPLIAGTKRQCYDYLQAMFQAFALIDLKK